MLERETPVPAAQTGEPPWWWVLREPTVPALLLATIAHVARRNVVDVAVFLGLAVLVVADRLFRGGTGVRRPLRRLPLPVVLLAAVAYGLLALSLGRAGRWLPVLLALPGVAGLVAVLRSRPPTHRLLGPNGSSGGLRGWPVWPALLVLGCLLELANFLMQPDAQTSDPDHPVISSLVDPLLAQAPVRAVVCALWLAVGWWLLRILTAGGER